MLQSETIRVVSMIGWNQHNKETISERLAMYAIIGERDRLSAILEERFEKREKERITRTQKSETKCSVR